MYTLVSALAKPLNGNGKWIDLDISNSSMHDLFSAYSEIIAILSNPFLLENVAVNLNVIRGIAGGLSITFNEFLIQNGDNALTPLDKIPTLKSVYVKYADAFHAGYKITPINSRAAIDSQLPLSEKTWLYLTKPMVDYSLFYRSCLVNVNGFFHLTYYDINGVYVKDGMKSNFLSKENNIGICSFRELGSLSFMPITEEMIYKQNDTEAYKDFAYID